MNAPLVSVVVPVFNGMSFLPKTVDSVLGQDYPDIELVLVDGGSSDAPPEEPVPGDAVPGREPDEAPSDRADEDPDEDPDEAPGAAD